MHARAPLSLTSNTWPYEPSPSTRLTVIASAGNAVPRACSAARTASAPRRRAARECAADAGAAAAPRSSTLRADDASAPLRIPAGRDAPAASRPLPSSMEALCCSAYWLRKMRGIAALAENKEVTHTQLCAKKRANVFLCLYAGLALRPLVIV